MKKSKTAGLIAAVVIAGGLAFAGSASAAPAAAPASAAVAAGTTTATVATPGGSFHIPVVPYPFSGSGTTTFTLYTLPACSSSATTYEVFLSTQGVEQEFAPPLGSTLVLSDTFGDQLIGSTGANGAIPTPFQQVDFSQSGLNGFVTAAGDYSLGVKCFSSTGVTNVWWTTVDFDAAATSTTTPNWKWEPLDSI
jgi:hypothetical protein